LSWCDSFFSLPEYYLANLNGESVWNWITNQISNIHKSPMVNEAGIIVLLRSFWVSTGKEKATMGRVFILSLTCFCNSKRWEFSEYGFERGAQISQRSNGESVQDRCFSETCCVGCGKRKGFERRKGKLT